MGKRPLQNPALRGEPVHVASRHDAREAPTLKRDVPSELREHPPQHITTKLRKQDIEEILEKDKAAKALPPNPEDSLLVDDEAAAQLLLDKEKKKKESGIRAARGTEKEEALNRFERREINDTLPAPPNDDDN
jgi:hypothetical protein